MEIDEEELLMNAEEEEGNAEASGSGTGGFDLGQGGGEGEVKMSKSAQKKMARKARIQALRPAQRLAEKERRKTNRNVLKEKAASGTLTAEEKAVIEGRKKVKRDIRVAKDRLEKGLVGEWRGGVVIDLGFDELMTDNEISSMAQQISYTYSANRTAARPFATVLHTSFSPTSSPRLRERMTKSQWAKWTRCGWWGEGIGDLAKAMSRDNPSAMSQGPLPSEEPISISNQPISAEPPLSDDKPSTSTESVNLESYLTGPNLPAPISSKTHKLIYLSADADEELTTLSEDEVYIIGGIVDRNRHKYLCQNKADTLNIRTARLPIGTYLENLPTRKVLTVNQVFQILVEYIRTQSWSEAFEVVIPHRKYSIGKGRVRRKKGVVKGDGEDDGEGQDAEDGEEGGEEVEEGVNELGGGIEPGDDEENALNRDQA